MPNILATLQRWIREKTLQLGDSASAAAARTMAVSLAAARLYEDEETDLNALPWADLPNYVWAAMSREQMAFEQLQSIESQFSQRPLALIAADVDQIQAYRAVH